jgi:hypothetical protein
MTREFTMKTVLTLLVDSKQKYYGTLARKGNLDDLHNPLHKLSPPLSLERKKDVTSGCSCLGLCI